LEVKNGLKKVNEHYSFPCKMVFYLIKNRNGSTAICSAEIKSQCQIENVRYSRIAIKPFDSEASAILSVKKIFNAEEYFEEVKRLKRTWGFALIDKENKGEKTNE
jgi:hypothetical protein